MKILFLTGDINFTDGVSSHLFNLLSKLSGEKKDEFHLICPGGNAIDKFYHLDVKITADINLKHDSRSILKFSKAFFNIRKYCIENKIDIIHSHNHYAANIAVRAAKKSGIKTVQTIHGLIPEGGRLEHFKADVYISLNENISKYLKTNNIAEDENIFTVRQGIPENWFFRKKVFSDNSVNDIPVILHASRLVSGKGADIFIKASAEVRKKYSGKIEFIIAGSGKEERELHLLAENLNSEIEFTGDVNDMFQLMKRADVFVNATTLQSEGFPMTVAEAAFCGCLIISSSGNWLDNIYKTKESAFCFGIKDYKDLADKILKALNDKAWSQNIAESFQDKAFSLFSLNELVQRHKIIYEKCLKQN